MWKVILLSLGLAALSSCDPVKYQDCGSVSGKIQSVDITPCPQEPCGLKHNTNITVKVEFAANVQVTSAKTVVHGIIAGVPVPFPVPSDGCKDMTCPVAQGASATYNNAVFVNPSYPKLKLIVKWELQDQNSKDIFCFAVPAEVTD